MSNQRAFKLLMVGTRGCGKSCLVSRLMEEEFPTVVSQQVGLDLKTRHVKVNGKEFKLQIWDCPGQDRFRQLMLSYYREADGIMVCYDTTNMDSFEEIKTTYLDEIDRLAPDNVSILLVGTRSDLSIDRKVPLLDVQELSDYYGIPSIETSALTGHNVAVAITALTLDMINGGVVSKSPSIKSLSVVGFNNSKENVTIYDISVKTKIFTKHSYVLRKRYNEFRNFYAAMVIKYPKSALVGFHFPPKSLFNWQHVKQRRQEAFHRLMQILIAMDPWPKEVDEFLEVARHSGTHSIRQSQRLATERVQISEI